MSGRHRSRAFYLHGYDWQDDAACRGLGDELFFEGDGENSKEKARREIRAKAVCAGCPVQLICLTYAIMADEKHGIWGGLNATERKVYARRRLA